MYGRSIPNNINNFDLGVLVSNPDIIEAHLKEDSLKFKTLNIKTNKEGKSVCKM
jgi:hypothetical protein